MSTELLNTCCMAREMNCRASTVDLVVAASAASGAVARLLRRAPINPGSPAANAASGAVALQQSGYCRVVGFVVADNCRCLTSLP
jgi:hypothetical protein